MLVLTRKLQEQIRIGDNVTITVLRVKGNTVRIGIEAPRETRVVRGELPAFDEGVAESASAASFASDDAENESAENEGAPLAVVLSSLGASRPKHRVASSKLEFAGSGI